MPAPARWERVEGDGVAFDAHVVPGNAESGRAIVLLQEIFGINEALRDTADMIAEYGYAVYGTR